MRRLLAILALLASSAAGEAAAQPPEGGGIALLPLRSRGVTPAEHRRIAGRLAASFRQTRSDVLAPDELASRLARDERRRGALEEARRLVALGTERSLNLESAAALAAFDRAIALWRENFGEWVDPVAMADAFVRRAAEKLESDAAGAKADLYAAVTIAPDRTPSIDDFPPKVVEGFEVVRAERARDSFRADDPRALAALGAALGTASVAVTRAERGDRIEDGVGVEVAVFAVRIPDSPPRTSRAVLPSLVDGGLERLDAMVDAVSGRGTALAVRTDDLARPTRSGPPVQRPVRRPERPLWKNPWVWVGTGALAVLGAGVGVYATQRNGREESDDGFKVILEPAPPQN